MARPRSTKGNIITTFIQDPAIKSGMVKCRDTIIMTVGTNAKQYDKKMVEVENGWG